MTVAPIPVVPLHSIVLPVVLAITPVLCYQVTSVGAVFVVVPVMVITVVPIVDSDLDATVLRSWVSDDGGWCSNGISQAQQTDVTTYIAYDVVSQPEKPRVRTPGTMTMYLSRRDVCSVQHVCETKLSPKCASLSLDSKSDKS
jgi:hypothetical protein